MKDKRLAPLLPSTKVLGKTLQEAFGSLLHLIRKLAILLTALRDSGVTAANAYAERLFRQRSLVTRTKRGENLGEYLLTFLKIDRCDLCFLKRSKLYLPAVTKNSFGAFREGCFCLFPCEARGGKGSVYAPLW